MNRESKIAYPRSSYLRTVNFCDCGCDIWYCSTIVILHFSPQILKWIRIFGFTVLPKCNKLSIFVVKVTTTPFALFALSRLLPLQVTITHKCQSLYTYIISTWKYSQRNDDWKLCIHTRPTAWKYSSMHQEFQVGKKSVKDSDRKNECQRFLLALTISFFN